MDESYKRSRDYKAILNILRQDNPVIIDESIRVLIPRFKPSFEKLGTGARVRVLSLLRRHLQACLNLAEDYPIIDRAAFEEIFNIWKHDLEPLELEYNNFEPLYFR